MACFRCGSDKFSDFYARYDSWAGFTGLDLVRCEDDEDYISFCFCESCGQLQHNFFEKQFMEGGCRTK